MSQHNEEFLASTDDMTGLLSLEESTDEALQRVVRLASGVATAADGVGITLVTWGAAGSIPTMRTAAHSDPWVLSVDIDQYETGEGPCIDSIIRGEIVDLRDLDEGSYPKFCTRASREGLGSVLAIPLKINDNKAVGALNLYARASNAFDESARSVASNFAAHATIALVNIELYEGARKLTHQLGEAMDSRAVIEQAKGILMGREHCTADEAFGRLKEMSQVQNIKVRQLATTMVGEGGTRP